MQYLRLANYKITKGTFPEIVDDARVGMLGTFKAQPAARLQPRQGSTEEEPMAMGSSLLTTG